MNTITLLVGFVASAELTDDQAMGVLASIWEHGAKGDWWPVFGPIVLVSVWGFKKFDQDIPKFGPAISRFMDNPMVSFMLPFLFSTAAGFGNAMATGHSPKEALVPAGKVAMEAITLYIAGKKAAEQFKNAVDAPPKQ